MSSLASVWDLGLNLGQNLDIIAISLDWNRWSDFECKVILEFHYHLKGKVKALESTVVKIVGAQNTTGLLACNSGLNHPNDL